MVIGRPSPRSRPTDSVRPSSGDVERRCVREEDHHERGLEHGHDDLTARHVAEDAVADYSPDGHEEDRDRRPVPDLSSRRDTSAYARARCPPSALRAWSPSSVVVVSEECREAGGHHLSIMIGAETGMCPSDQGALAAEEDNPAMIQLQPSAEPITRARVSSSAPRRSARSPGRRRSAMELVRQPRHQPHRHRRELRRLRAADRAVAGRDHRDDSSWPPRPASGPGRGARDPAARSSGCGVDQVDLIQLHNLVDETSGDRRSPRAARSRRGRGARRGPGPVHRRDRPRHHHRRHAPAQPRALRLRLGAAALQLPDAQNAGYLAEFEALVAICAERGTWRCRPSRPSPARRGATATRPQHLVRAADRQDDIDPRSLGAGPAGSS